MSIEYFGIIGIIGLMIAIFIFALDSIRYRRKNKELLKSANDYARKYMEADKILEAENDKYQDLKKLNSKLSAENNQYTRQLETVRHDLSFLRESYSRDFQKLNRSLIKIQSKWIMHARAFPIFRNGVKSLVALNIAMHGGKIKNWPEGFDAVDIRLMVEGPKGKRYQFSIFGPKCEALDWIKTTPKDW